MDVKPLFFLLASSCLLLTSRVSSEDRRFLAEADNATPPLGAYPRQTPPLLPPQAQLLPPPPLVSVKPPAPSVPVEPPAPTVPVPTPSVPLKPPTVPVKAPPTPTVPVKPPTPTVPVKPPAPTVPVKPPTPAPAPIVKPPKTRLDCIPLCVERCKLHSRKNRCARACMTCCERCKCVPPGTYGNREKCGKCYTDMTTRGGRLKCP